VKNRHLGALIEELDHKLTLMGEIVEPYRIVRKEVDDHKNRIEKLEQMVEVLRAVARDQEQLLRQLQDRQAN
jgi:hypothetical protein